MVKKRESYRLTQETVLERFRSVHGDKYDYSDVVYTNQRAKIPIKCPKHGVFWQTAKNHMKGQGCPVCGKEYARTWTKNNPEYFLKTSRERFGDNYSFPFIVKEYENSHSKLTIECNRCHNRFIKIACDHITSPFGGCRHCYAFQSGDEVILANLVQTTLPGIEVRFNDRRLLNGLELDIYIPSLKLAIEFNGCYWHSEARQDLKCHKYYHLNKTELCEKQGVQLIHIFEDEIKLHRDIVLEKIRHLLHQNIETKIYARKCKVLEIDHNIASVFLDTNHIQGHDKATVRLGLYENELLVAVMTFIRNSGKEWTLNRYATIPRIRIVGGAGKLLAYFVRQYTPNEVKSFADRRWSTTLHQNLYDRLGFKLVSISRPDYRYVFPKDVRRHHKFGFRKEYLHKKYGFPLEMTESQMVKRINAHRIWDCGLLKYVIKFNS